MSERDVMNHGSSLHLATGEPHRARARPTRALLAAATAVIAVGCAHAKPQSSPEPSMSSPVSTQTVANQPAPIQAADLARTTVRGQAATVEVEMGFYAATGTVDVRYRLRNNDPAKPLAVFDRGNRHEVSIGRQTLGAIAAPTWKGMGEEVELFHVAAPLPNPRPISPPSPLALEVAAGGELRGGFKFALLSGAPKRLRWCLGVLPWQASYFDSPSSTDAGKIWRASFAVANEQETLCTPWYDVAKGAFAP
jgi:hypothetical protein